MNENSRTRACRNTTLRNTIHVVVMAAAAVGIVLLGDGLAGSQNSDTTPSPAAKENLPPNFNHDATSFPLLGAHRELKCSQCHFGGRYRGLQNTCENCHNNQLVEGKPQNHLRTTQSCTVCHTVSAWIPATFRHDLATVAGQCSTCHNGQTATGKPQNHIVTTSQCDTCHGTTAWLPVSYASHDNPKLIGAHAPLDCRVCHTTSFSTAYYRDGTTYGSCANCHTRNYVYPGPDAHKNAGPTFADSLRVNATCSNCHEHASYQSFGN